MRYVAAFSEGSLEQQWEKHETWSNGDLKKLICVTYMLYGDVIIPDLCVHDIYIRSYLAPPKEVVESISPPSCSFPNVGVGCSCAFSEAEWYSNMSLEDLLSCVSLCMGKHLGRASNHDSLFSPSTCFDLRP
jgi:hypothetical protein